MNSPGREGTRRETTGREGLECERERKLFEEWEENLRKTFISICCRYNKHLLLEKKSTQRANNSKVNNKENNKVWEVRWLSGFRFFFSFLVFLCFWVLVGFFHGLLMEALLCGFVSIP